MKIICFETIQIINENIKMSKCSVVFELIYNDGYSIRVIVKSLIYRYILFSNKSLQRLTTEFLKLLTTIATSRVNFRWALEVYIF